MHFRVARDSSSYMVTVIEANLHHVVVPEILDIANNAIAKLVLDNH